MNEFTKRTIFGALYVAVVIACVLLSSDATDTLFMIIAALAVCEFHRLMHSSTGIIFWSIIATAAIYTQRCCPEEYAVYCRTVFVLALILGLGAELFRKAENPIQNWGYMLVSVVMIGMPFSLMPDILRMGEWGSMRLVLLALFVCIWTNDTGAYCVGSLIGKHKMFPRVSPGKSWEGLVGGFIASLIAGYVFSLFEPIYAAWQWMLIAFTISVFGTFGDLMESLMKRTIGVKDSGNFLPGHGGVLDRFDSILLATPAVWVLLQLFACLA